MCIHIYLFYIYMYVYVYICICMCIYVYKIYALFNLFSRCNVSILTYFMHNLCIFSLYFPKIPALHLEKYIKNVLF